MRDLEPMTLAELSAQPEWYALSPRLRRILTMYLEAGATDMQRVLVLIGGTGVTQADADEILQKPEVVAVLERRKNGIDYSHLKPACTGDQAFREYLQKLEFEKVLKEHLRQQQEKSA
jgi:hypothetical protein